MLLRRGAVDQATVVRMSKKTKKLAVERRDGSFLDRVQVPSIDAIPFYSVIAAPLCIRSPVLNERRVRLLAIQADATKRETHAYKHAELRAADDNCTFKPQINKSSKQRHGRSVEELSRGDAAHNLDLKVSEMS